MPLEACKDEATCIRNREEYLIHAHHLTLQDYPCGNCPQGAARMTKVFTPESESYGNNCIQCGVARRVIIRGSPYCHRCRYEMGHSNGYKRETKPCPNCDGPMHKESIQCQECYQKTIKNDNGKYFIKAPKDYILPAEKKKYNSASSWRNPSKWR